MQEHVSQTIRDMQERLRELEQTVSLTKKTLNYLHEAHGEPPPYPDEDSMSNTGRLALRPDAFYGKALNTSVKTLLELRRAANENAGPATADEIYDGLIAGGYSGFASNREDAITGLKISLGKSSHTFARLPHGSYGLAEWYGTVPKRRPTRRSASVPDDLNNGESELTEEGDSEEPIDGNVNQSEEKGDDEQ